MPSKCKAPTPREVTHYTRICSQMRNAEFLESSLSAGSTNRLRQFRKNLSVTVGKDKRLFDGDCLNLLKEYAINRASVNRSVDYLQGLVCEDGIPFSRSYKNYASTEDQMEGFALPDHPSFRWNENYIKSLEELKAKFSSLKLQPLIYHSDEDILEALPKVDTHSGWTYINSGLKKKGDNVEGSFERYTKNVEKIHRGERLNRPIMVAFRTQASGEFQDDGTETNSAKHKTRVVSMVDMDTVILERMFQFPIQKFLSWQDFYAGGKEPNVISGLISNWRVVYSKFLSIDYSKFDQSISSWLIRDAFSIIKSAFVMDQLHSEVFDSIVEDFIDKDFILSEGDLHSTRGVPSGSMFTQIIDSMVNWLAVRTYFNSLRQKCSMIIMGDDNAIFTNVEVTLEELASYMLKNFGLIVKTDDKSSQGDTKKDNVKFLSRYWRYDGQWRHPNQLLSRILYPERRRDYDGSVKPEHVIFAFILTYQKGMEQLIDTRRFLHEHPISKKLILEQVDSRYLPGALAYIREYT